MTEVTVVSNIIDGKAIAEKVQNMLAVEVAEITEKTSAPGLAVVLVGEDPASKVYVRNKKNACTKLGIYSEVYRLPETTTQPELLELIAKLNGDDKINGILVQSPLPSHIDESIIVNNILPEKDVDAFHPFNVGRIMLGDYAFLPCTPAGVVELIDSTGIDVSGKSCVVVGRSNIVGKPMSMLMLHRNATVTICHSRTADLAAVTRSADILIVATGKAKMISGDMIKKGAVVIDVGINRGEDGKLCGDVDFMSAKDVAGYITPVPGGVGPMTITMLMRNTITAKKLAENLL